MFTQFLKIHTRLIKKSMIRKISILTDDIALNSKNKVGFQCMKTKFDGENFEKMNGGASEEYQKKSMCQLADKIHDDLREKTLSVLYVKKIDQTSLATYKPRNSPVIGHLVSCLVRIDKEGKIDIIQGTYLSKIGPKKAVYQNQLQDSFISAQGNSNYEYYGSSQYYTFTNLSETSITVEEYIKSLSYLKANDLTFDLYENNCSHACLKLLGIKEAQAVSPQTASIKIDQETISDDVLRQNIKILCAKNGLNKSGYEVYKSSPYSQSKLKPG